MTNKLLLAFISINMFSTAYPERGIAVISPGYLNFAAVMSDNLGQMKCIYSFNQEDSSMHHSERTLER